MTITDLDPVIEFVNSLRFFHRVRNLLITPLQLLELKQTLNVVLNSGFLFELRAEDTPTVTHEYRKLFQCFCEDLHTVLVLWETANRALDQRQQGE
jgi:hypothetical protein